ncbi:zinc finger protein 91-like [Eupeodes corollae]|uniref:zinc finger protein 91-like n=1 Tax=Eupeodes corollae TaxID=290404 RepID=UPI0024937F5E|nr:zinc finger protein 91-like [Eupeodes corollae]
MVQHWMSWCRLCAREDPNNTHTNVLLKNEEGLPLTSTIALCFSIDINNFCNLPNKICSECYRLIRSTIDLKDRITKVSAMFAELQLTSYDGEEFDARKIKARHNLEYDFKVFATNSSSIGLPTDFETRDKLLEIDEEMIDHEMINCNKTIDSNPIKIKLEGDEEDEINVNFDRLDSQSDESSDSSSAAPEKSSVAVKNHTNKTKKKYRKKTQIQAENLSKPHYCSECCKGFLKLHNYRRHMHYAHGVTMDLKPPLFVCENCGKEYRSISALREHEHSHTEERTLKCKYCEKTFKGIPSLRLHEDTHNETNYICVVCGLKLNTQRTLRMHMIVHSDQRKHKCDHCGNEFKRAKDLKNHLILHTGLKPYSCDFCDRTFASGANCRSHKKKSHPVELAEQEAAGKKNTKAKMPKLSELKAVISKLNQNGQEEKASVQLKAEVDGPNNRDKSLDSSSSKEESGFFHGIFGKKCLYLEKMVQHWMSWCRLCAREDPSNTHTNVLLKNEEGLPLTSTIALCFSIDINNFCNLPNKICSECYRLIRSTIDLKERITKVSAMFAELQLTSYDGEEFDARVIKARHNLEYDFKVFATNSSSIGQPTDLEKRDKLLEIDEEMIDHEMINCNKTIDLNPIKIKLEEDEEDDINVNFDRLDSQSDESSDSSSAAPEKSSVAIKKQTNKTKKKYRKKTQIQAENLSKPHYCSECCKGFLKLHNYRRHMHYTHGVPVDLKPPLFVCENCGKEHSSISALREHEHSHTDERTLKCKYCEKTFKGINSLRNHEDTHNETNYICVICGLKLNTQRTLRMHMLVHSDQRKHKCDHCGNEFKRAKDLKNHLILHTGLKPYSCDFCDRTFASGANCRSHKKKSHPVELAEQEAAGKKNTKAKMPKLSELKAVISKLNQNGQEEKASVQLKAEVDGPSNRDKSLDSSSSNEESGFFHGIFGKKCLY